MRDWLKKYFIPHQGNEHHPHILRTEALVFLLAVVMFAEAVFLISTLVILPGSNFFSLILPQALVEAANSERTTLHEGTLVTNPLLEQAAQLKAQDMVQKGYFAHTSPEGRTPWYWIQKVGYKYTTAGENLAVNFLDSRDVHTAWMNSPGHRANILNNAYTEIGIGTATGMYKGYETTFVVQYFGKPRAALPVKKPVAIAATLPPAPLDTPLATPVLSTEPVLAMQTPAVSPAPLAMLAAEPRTTTSHLLLIIAGIIVVALALTFFVRMEFLHPALVLKPMLVIVIIISLLVINRAIGISHAAIF